MVRICDLLATLDEEARKRVTGYVVQRVQSLTLTEVPRAANGPADADVVTLFDEQRDEGA